MSEKKYYVVGATTPQGWDRIHSILTQDGTLDDNIPARAVECTDLKDHSPTRAVYLLDDEEAAQLSNCADVKFIHLEQSKYRELFPPKPDELRTASRYTTDAKQYRQVLGQLPISPNSTDKNRSGYQILRGTQQTNPWVSTATTVINSTVTNVTGTGIDVDLVVSDDGCWFGHVEFANNTGNGPVDYKWANAGNPLSSTGTCDVLDLVLDSPYYIDPAWFNASPGTRLMTRWDGTIVPQETAARAWWGSGSQRSAEFASAGTVDINVGYARSSVQGSNTAKPLEGDHGTATCGQAFGRTHGWAYNANKWFIDSIGDYSTWPVDNFFDILKIFHQNKPTNLTHGNKNPTVTSNSWGYRTDTPSTGYYYYRSGTSGSGGVGYSGMKPAFMYFLGSTGDGGRFKGEMVDNSMTEAGDELIASGVIFVAAAGNSNQKQVGSSHPDFNNYWSNTNSTPLASATHDEFGATCYNTVHRRGFPQHLGKYTSGSNIVYPVINIGALDDSYQPDGKERKVNYSDMGPEIDCYAPGDGSLTSARSAYGSAFPRYDQRIEPGSLSSKDTLFSGTSSACPSAAGMIATALQYNRTWTWQDVRIWLHSLTEQSSLDFYQGPDPVGPSATEWNDLNSLLGGTRRVIYNNISSALAATLSIANKSLDINQAATPFIPVTAGGGTPPYIFSIGPTLPTGLAINTGTGSISGTPTILHSTSSFAVTVTDTLSATSSTSFSLNVTAPALTTTLAISSKTLSFGQSATPFIPVTVSGGIAPYIFSISPSLPTGLAINTGSGSISGTPTILHSTSSFAVTVTDNVSQTSNRSFSLNVTAPPLTATVAINFLQLVNIATMNTAIPVVGSGGFGTLTYSITPSLPLGLSFNTSNGAITGTPATTYSLQYHNVIVSDGALQIVSQNFGLEIVPALVLTVSSPSVRLTYGRLLTSPITPITVSGGIGAKTYSITPTLPTGLSFNLSSGQITGTPTSAIPQTTFTVTVTDSSAYSITAAVVGSVTFTLEVEVLPLLISTSRRNLVEIFGKTIDPFNPITITSGNAPYSWAVTPALPTGISFGSTGTIYGTPSESLGPRVTSTYHTITVTDVASQVKSEVIRLKLSRDNVILSDDSNYIRDYFFEFAGTTSTGYGANLKGQNVLDGDIIQAANWDNLLLDTDRILVHQNGNNDNIIPSATTGTVILAAVPDRMYTAAQFLEINKETVHPSQLAFISHNTPVSITEDWTCTNYVTTASMILGSSNNGYITAVNWSWAYHQQLNYFFNLGGKIVPDITIVGGRQRDIDGWQPVVDEINGLTFGTAEFLEALQSDDLSWEYIAIGEGNTDNPTIPKGRTTDDYKTNGIILTYQIVGSTIIGSVHYLVGLGKKKKKKDKKKWGKKTKKGFIRGEWIRVSLYVETDFKTTYVVGNNGGISSQKPQTQLVSNYVSASPAPLAEFSFATGLSDSQIVTLNNNSTLTCVVSDIILEGYTTGTITPTSLSIPPHSNSAFAIQYAGTTPGYYKGTVRVLQNVNPLTLFTEVNVGSVTPPKLITTITNTSVITQDFLVDHRGGDYNKFEVAFPDSNPAGFTYLDIVENSQDTFRVVFDPTVIETNGTFQTTATVTIYPLDSSLDLIDMHVPISITTNVVFYQGLGNWVSALGYDNSCLGLTYDIIGGIRYLTVGIGYGEDLSIDDLQTENPTGWETIYRIPINKGIASEILYTNDYLVSDVDNIGNYFGIGNATGSILTVKNYRGNLEIDLNILSNDSSDPDQQKVLEGLEGAFYYHDETLYRNSQLLLADASNQTEYFTGFDVHGNTITDLVAANIS
jgi:hypothetical protein